MYLKLILYFILISFLFSQCTNYSYKTEINKKDSIFLENLKIIENTKTSNNSYSITFNNNDTIYLFRKYPLNQDVTIVDYKVKKSFHTKTVGYFVFEDELLGKIVLTSIIYIKDYKNEDFCFVFIGNKYKLTEFQPIEDVTDDAVIIKIDSLVRATDYLNKLLISNNGIIEFKDTILQKRPEIKRVKANKFSYYIVTYNMKGDYEIGPRLIVLNEKIVFPLTGQCSFESIYPFNINGINYIQTGSACCGCGIIGFQLFVIEEDAVKTEFEEFGLSN